MSSNPSRTSAALTTYSGLSPALPATCTPELESGAGSVAPVAPIIPHVQTVHGELRSDDYFWLRNRTDPAVVEYLEAENNYAAAVMQHTEGLQQQLYHEMRGRIKETDLTVAEPL